MCGISGIINKHNQPVNQSLITSITDIIAHRGPDGFGYFYGDFFAFGHRRLSIIDLSEAGHQPMEYRGKYTLTYNGEIYNYLEIKQELEQEGYPFHSHTDTEVILAAYDKWGKECVNKFNGMWAFALFDKEKNILFCSRDRFGVKPFYYSNTLEIFAFGSEIKQLLPFHPKRIVNTNILTDYLLYGLEEHTDETFFSGVKRLKPSHNLMYNLSNHTYTIEPYFSLMSDSNIDTLSEEQSMFTLHTVLTDAIELRLRSDVRVGTCLSGGLDSSSIAAIAAPYYFQKTHERFSAIHAKSMEAKTDESAHAKTVAKHCNLNLIITEPSLESITEIIDEVVYTQEEPFGGPSIIMQYFVMKTAKENNCLVMLDGQGADEILFGYESYYVFYFASLLKSWSVYRYVYELIKLKNFKLTKLQIVRSSFITLFRNELSKLEMIFWKKSLPFIVPIKRKRLDSLFEFTGFKDFQIREVTTRNLPHLLRYEDKNSMRHGVETRLPFVDYRVAQTAISINNHFKFKDGFLKYILRKTVQTLLPHSIVWRTDKFGFEAPTDTWIASHRDVMIQAIHQSPILQSILDVQKISFDNTTHLWRLYNVSVWEKIYKVKFHD
jgi:asparagine synthase (glutamine-hydrolysing)